MLRVLMAAIVLVATLATIAPVAAQDLPTIPDPVAVTLPRDTTAVLSMDFITTSCQPRQECLEALPGVAGLLDNARGAGVLVIHSIGRTVIPHMTQVAPLPDEAVVSTGADKFFNTNLDEMLREHGIATVVLVGQAANGAVMYTGFEANLRGYTVVVATDGLASETRFETALARWQLLNQPGFTNVGNEPLRPGVVTLSRTDLISFE